MISRVRRKIMASQGSSRSTAHRDSRRTMVRQGSSRITDSQDMISRDSGIRIHMHSRCRQTDRNISRDHSTASWVSRRIMVRQGSSRISSLGMAHRDSRRIIMVRQGGSHISSRSTAHRDSSRTMVRQGSSHTSSHHTVSRDSSLHRMTVQWDTLGMSTDRMFL